MPDEANKERKWLLQEVEGLLSFITYPILVVDRAGRVIHVNPAAEHIWRRSQVVLLNQTLQGLVDSSKLLEWVEKGKPLRDFPVQITDASGKLSPFLCRSHPLFVNRKAEGAILQFTEQMAEAEFEKNRKYVTRYTFDDIRGHSPGIMALKEQARKIAKSDSTVLIRGESGTGKEVLAQSIHQASSRSTGPFVAINCRQSPKLCWRASCSDMKTERLRERKKEGSLGVLSSRCTGPCSWMRSGICRPTCRPSC